MIRFFVTVEIANVDPLCNQSTWNDREPGKKLCLYSGTLIPNFKTKTNPDPINQKTPWATQHQEDIVRGKINNE
jgi:hypothetical protein